MNNLEERLHQDGQNVHLLKSEKQAMKNRILAMPITEKSGQSMFNFLQIFQSKKVIAFAVFAFLLLTGVPITYAAQHSGPGDFLHGFELSVIEPVEHMISFTNDSQIAYSIDRLEERLDELQAVHEGQISDEQVAIATENIQEYANEALAVIPESNQKEEVNHLIKISALLNAHEDVLLETQQEESIENLNDEVAVELSDQVEEYAKQQSKTELAETVKREVSETTNLIGGDDDPTAVAIGEILEDAQEKIVKGNLEEALQDTIDAKVQALTQDYTEDIDNEQTKD